MRNFDKFDSGVVDGSISPIILEVFFSHHNFGDSSGFSVPYYFGINFCGDLYYGRGYCDLLGCLWTLSSLSKDKVVIYCFDLVFLYSILESDGMVEPCKRRKKDDGSLLKFEMNNLIFKSIRFLSGAQTFESFNKINLDNLDMNYERGLKTEESKLRGSDIWRMEKCLKNEYNFICRVADEEDGFNNIPLTLAGTIKNRLSLFCLGDENKCKYQYQKQIGISDWDGKPWNRHWTLPIRNLEHFNILRRTFAGGYVGYNLDHVGETVEDVACFDFTSSYVARICESRFFPRKYIGFDYCVKLDDILKYRLKHNFCILNVTLTNLRSVHACKCLRDTGFVDKKNTGYGKKTIVTSESSNIISDKDFVISADKICLWITNIDLKYIRLFYKFDEIAVNYAEYYECGRLPENYLKVILDLFKEKSYNKNNPDSFMEVRSKARVNITWGNMVTGFFGHTDDELVDEIESYTKFRGSFRNRCSAYQWGIACTSFARYYLLSFVYSLGDDWLYSDTDSIYFKNRPEHIEMIKKYNLIIRKCLLRFYKDDEISVKSKYCDKVYNLGEMTCEGFYKRFKYLRAKTYLKESETGRISMCLSGCSNIKDSFFDTLDDPFSWFDYMDGSVIPVNFCDNFKVNSFGHIDTYVEDYEGVSRHVVLPGGKYKCFIDFIISSEHESILHLEGDD